VILKAETLFELDKKPYIDQISLELLRQYYEQFLEPYIYLFELENGVVVNLDFNKKSFCHLIGVEKMAIGAVKFKDRYKYFGTEGYNNIKNGLITIKHLKQLNKGRFNFIKDKLVFFYLIPKIVEAPEILLDFVLDETDNSLIEAKLLVYSSTEEAYVHIGIDEDSDSKRYFPRTFLIERINKDNDGTKFIKGKTPFKVIKAEKIERTSKTGQISPTG
jgi:hypothetical protein